LTAMDVLVPTLVLGSCRHVIYILAAGTIIPGTVRATYQLRCSGPADNTSPAFMMQVLLLAIQLNAWGRNAWLSQPKGCPGHRGSTEPILLPRIDAILPGLAENCVTQLSCSSSS
jgi:hypothetical protein